MNLNLIEKLATQPELKTIDSDQLFIINGISWEIYESLLQSIGDDFPGLRITYLDGTLELMSPSRRYEVDKKAIASLVEAYLQETRTRYYPLGSTTFRKQAKAGGIEPDECYCINSAKPIPDIAIEVVVTSGGINSLEVYKGLEVPEVWFWQNHRFSLYHLRGEQYEPISKSELLPGLDFDLLANYVRQPELLDAVWEFREIIRRQME